MINFVYAVTTILLEINIAFAENFGNVILERTKDIAVSNTFVQSTLEIKENYKNLDEYTIQISSEEGYPCKSPCPPNAELCIYMCE